MPSKYLQIRFRLPRFRILFGNEADKFVQAIASHPQVEDALRNERCPICGNSFKECEYFKRLENE